MAAIDAHELKEHWLNQALTAASIDRRHWHPAAGVEENKQTIQAVYGYYGRRFADEPFLLWAGMANMIGATFYAAFLDLSMVPDAMRRLATNVLGRLRRTNSAAAAGELGFYETLFLIMQKKIFEDQASMHEAYLGGGLAEIERFYQAGIIDLATFAAWREIDRGRSQDVREALESGCRMLLWREQRDIIGHFYVTMMNHHGLEGHVFTYLMTLGGAPSVPGARSESEVYPFFLEARLARDMLRLTTPLARGNIARFTNRWTLIEADTLPAYLKYILEHADDARKSALRPIAERAAAYRLRARALPLACAVLTRWRLVREPTPVPGADTTTTVTEDSLVLDLDPPNLGDLGVAAPSASHIWTGPGGHDLQVEVRLPGQRVYCALAELVVAMSFAGDAQPNQLTVSLPPSGLDITERRLQQYGADWAIHPDELTRWRDGVQRVRASSDRTYATHVLTPPALGDVQLEFEVAHHVREEQFHITALFSWPTQRPARRGAEETSTG